jgi:hypothetical protein
MFGMKLLALMNSMIIFSGHVLSDTGCRPIKYELTERPMRAKLILKIGADKENEDFYKPRSFAIDRAGRIFILDSGNSRIQCFSKEGAFRFSFGKPGQGPGELSKTASNIKILSDGNIYVIDNGQRRINVYTLEGKFLFFGKTSVYYDDIVLIDNAYYLSSILLDENYKPIDVSRTLGKVDGSFGIFVEPAVGLVKEIDKLPIPGWDRFLSGSGFTNLIVGKNNEIIFSQNNPYRLIKYDRDGRTLKDVSGDAGFDTFFQVNFTVKKNEVSVLNPKVARILDMSVRGDDFLVVPFLDPEREYFYVDIYNLDLNLVSRHKMPNSLVNDKKHEYLGQIFIDDEDNFYGLVSSQDNPPQLVKYKLFFH